MAEAQSNSSLSGETPSYTVSYPEEDKNEESVEGVVEIEEVIEENGEKEIPKDEDMEEVSDQNEEQSYPSTTTSFDNSQQANGRSNHDERIDDVQENPSTSSSFSPLSCDFCLRTLPWNYEKVQVFQCKHGLCRYCASINLEGESIRCLICGSGFGNEEHCKSNGSPEVVPPHKKPKKENNGQDNQSLIHPREADIIGGLIFTQTEFSCPICFCDIPLGDGILLNQCLHPFCTDCIRQVVEGTNTAQVRCPFVLEGGSGSSGICSSPLTDAEIRAFVTPEMYDAFLQRSVVEAEMANPNSFHCKRVDCETWFEVDPGLKGAFFCPSCNSVNCLDCDAVHEGVNCDTYQERLQQSNWDVKTKQLMQQKIKNGVVKKCPTCRVIIEKNGGCDHMKCTVCNKDFSWKTGIKPTVTVGAATTRPLPSSSSSSSSSEAEDNSYRLPQTLVPTPTTTTPQFPQQIPSTSFGIQNNPYLQYPNPSPYSGPYQPPLHAHGWESASFASPSAGYNPYNYCRQRPLQLHQSHLSSTTSWPSSYQYINQVMQNSLLTAPATVASTTSPAFNISAQQPIDTRISILSSNSAQSDSNQPGTSASSFSTAQNLLTSSSSPSFNIYNPYHHSHYRYDDSGTDSD